MKTIYSGTSYPIYNYILMLYNNSCDLASQPRNVPV